MKKPIEENGHLLIPEVFYYESGALGIKAMDTDKTENGWGTVLLTADPEDYPLRRFGLQEAGYKKNIHVCVKRQFTPELAKAGYLTVLGNSVILGTAEYDLCRIDDEFADEADNKRPCLLRRILKKLF